MWLWDIYERVNVKFGEEHPWRIGNITLTDLPDVQVEGTPKPSDLYHCVWLTFAFLAVRYVVERYIIYPIGVAAGITEPKIHLSHSHPVLETAFQHKVKSGSPEIYGIAKEMDMTERQVERWLRQRQKLSRPKVMKKFQESGWRFLVYSAAFIYGIYSLWEKPYLWDIKRCWDNFPYAPISPDIWWYYMLELGLYGSLTISQFFDIKRKDFWQMMFHHVITILLITMSYISNCVSIGSLVVIVHDAADIPLELAKFTNYAKKRKFSEVCLVVFVLVWLVTRLAIFPFRIIDGAIFDSIHVLGPGFYLSFVTLLIFLQILHFIWTWMILRVILTSLGLGGGMDGKLGDPRSENSEDSSSTGSRNKSNTN